MQFWGAEKDTTRLESAIFEDLNRYCWSQQNSTGSANNQSGNTDGQVSGYQNEIVKGQQNYLKNLLDFISVKQHAKFQARYLKFLFLNQTMHINL